VGAFKVAVDSGHADRAPMAAVGLGMVFQERGELVAAATAFQVANYSGYSRAAGGGQSATAARGRVRARANAAL